MKKELIDLLDEVSNPDVIIISSALKTMAAKLLKSINSDALSESPDVNEHEQAKEVCDHRWNHSNAKLNGIKYKICLKCYVQEQTD